MGSKVQCSLLKHFLQARIVEKGILTHPPRWLITLVGPAAPPASPMEAGTPGQPSFKVLLNGSQLRVAMTQTQAVERTIAVAAIIPIHSRKLTWKPKKGTVKNTVLLRRGYTRFHVSLGECITPIYYSSFHFIFHYPNITPILSEFARDLCPHTECT